MSIQEREKYEKILRKDFTNNHKKVINLVDIYGNTPNNIEAIINIFYNNYEGYKNTTLSGEYIFLYVHLLVAIPLIKDIIEEPDINRRYIDDLNTRLKKFIYRNEGEIDLKNRLAQLYDESKIGYRIFAYVLFGLYLFILTVVIHVFMIIANLILYMMIYRRRKIHDKKLIYMIFGGGLTTAVYINLLM